MTKASENQYPLVTFAESAAPSTPSSGLAYIYVKTDGKIYLKDDAGTETDITGAGGTTPDYVLNMIGYPTTVGGSDIVWNGDAAGMTTVTVTGSQTITEQNGLLSVSFSGQSSGDNNCLLTAHSFSIGDSFAVPMRCWHNGTAPTEAGIIFTDGTTSGAGAASAHLQYQNDSTYIRCYSHSGTLTAMSSASAVLGSYDSFGGWMWLRLTYQASNTFRKEVSYDGVSWTTGGISDITPTLTPTHFGVMWTKDGGSGTSLATFGPIVKLA